MGNNSSKWDNDAYLNAKTTRELEELLMWWQAEARRDSAISREQIQLIKMKIAERIGKAKK